MPVEAAIYLFFSHVYRNLDAMDSRLALPELEPDEPLDWLLRKNLRANCTACSMTLSLVVPWATLPSAWVLSKSCILNLLAYSVFLFGLGGRERC